MKKNDRKPTLKQKKLITTARLNAQNWLVRAQHEGQLTIVHRESHKVRQLSI